MSKRLVIYRAECGDELEIEQTLVSRIRFICCDCGIYHFYSLESVTEGVTWDEVVDEEVWNELQQNI